MKIYWTAAQKLAGIIPLNVTDDETPSKEVYEKTSSGIEIIEKLVQEHKIDCDWEPVDVLSCTLNSRHEEACNHLKHQYEVLGIDAKWLSKDMLSQRINVKGYSGALSVPGSAMVNPAKLNLSVGMLIKKRGVKIYENTPVIRIEPGSQIKVHLQYGMVQTPTLIIATNAYTPKLGFFNQRIIPVHSHSIVTAPLKDYQLKSLSWKGRECIISMADMFLLFRLTQDNRLLLAGKDAFYYYNGSIHNGVGGHPVFYDLIQSLRKYFPTISNVPVPHHWVEHVGFNLDAVPTVAITLDTYEYATLNNECLLSNQDPNTTRFVELADYESAKVDMYAPIIKGSDCV